MAENQIEKRFIYLDQVHSALSDLERVTLPSGAVQTAVRDTMDNLATAYPNRELVYKESTPLATDVAQHIRNRNIIFLDRHTFRNEIGRHNDTVLKAARARLYPIKVTPGMGPIVGLDENIDMQAGLITAKYAGQDVALVDDLHVSGWTFQKVLPVLEKAGVAVSAIGVAISSSQEDFFEHNGKRYPMYAGYRQGSEDKGSFELKNFLITPRTGAAHFKGAYADRHATLRILQCLETYMGSGRDSAALCAELRALKFDFDEQALLHKLAQMPTGEINTENAVSLLQTFRLPHLRTDLVGTTRSLYVGDYRSPAWKMEPRTWDEFSKRQLEVSIRLYEGIRDANTGSVPAWKLGIFDEFESDVTVPAEQYLRSRVAEMDSR
jgi:hypothetical protein